MIKKHTIILSYLTAAIILGFISVHLRALQPESKSGDGMRNAPTVYFDGAQTSYGANLNIDEVLVGASHNIFVGKVAGQNAVKQSGGTQFDVDVVLNIKGDLRGRVLVNTNALYTSGEIRVLRGSVWPQTGSTYLFATRFNPENNWYSLIAFYTHQAVSWKLISDDSSLTTAQLQQLATNDFRVNQLQAAYPREVLLHNDTLNSYRSLSEPEKAALPYYQPPPTPSPPSPTSTEQ